MEDTEDDYMSDKFLLAAENESKSTLLTSKAAKVVKQENRIKEKQKMNRRKPVKVMEHERREERLNQPLDESNKGFAMLAKMGFKSGMGLGKNESGISEPIPLNIKTGRSGLGQDTHVKEKKEKMIKARVTALAKRRKMTENMKGDFQSRLRGKLATRQIRKDLQLCQAACEQLDSAKGLQCIESWYWPKPITPQNDDESDKEDEEEEEEEDSDDQIFCKLQSIDCHLRSVHLYCIWCGTSYRDNEDISTNCPGNSFEDHNE